MTSGLKIDGLNILLNGDTTEGCVLKTPLKDELITLVQNREYHSYRTSNPCFIERESFHLSLFFEREVLTSVHLSPSGIGAEGWEDAASEKLLEVKQYNDRWLQNVFGKSPRVTLSWASIESTYDEKSWTAEIIFKFPHS